VEVKSDSRLGFSGVIEREYEEIRKVLQGRAVVMVVIERKATTAIANRRYDDEVRKFVESLGVEKIGKRLVNSREGPPVFEQPD
jgi:RNA-binding protein YhbY